MTLLNYSSASVLLFCASVLGGCSANADAVDNKTAAAKESASAPSYSAEGLLLTPLTIKTAEAQHDFIVEVAKTSEEQAKGLMFRTKLDPKEGMLFPFKKSRIASFWMKNTVIPLDIIFIRKDGTIESIAARTTPYSLEAVQSGAPVHAVLELAAGQSEKLSIAAGDIVTWDR